MYILRCIRWTFRLNANHPSKSTKRLFTMVSGTRALPLVLSSLFVLAAGQKLNDQRPGHASHATSHDPQRTSPVVMPPGTTSTVYYSFQSFGRPGTQGATSTTPSVTIPSNEGPSLFDEDDICRPHRTVCPRAIQCDVNNCLTPCTIVGQCNIPLCSTGSSNLAPCCNAAISNTACFTKRAICAQLDCGFLLA